MKRRREIKTQYADLPVLRAWSDFRPRPDNSIPLPSLKDPVPGFRCPLCTTFYTISRDSLRHHWYKEHPSQRMRLDSEALKCVLQFWTNRRMPGVAWTVDPRQVSDYVLRPEAGTSGPRGRSLDSQEEEEEEEEKGEDILRAEAAEERRLLAERDDAPALTQELEQDENTDWLRGCEWPQWFACRPLALIVAATQLPSLDSHHDFVLGSWQGIDCVILAAEERVLRRLVVATSLMFARCEETLQKTPRTLRCWLKSWSSLYLPYPFEMVQKEATKRRYYSYFQRFLCYIYRIWLLAKQLKERTIDISGLQLTTMQCTMMQNVWTGFAALVDDVNTLSDPFETTQSAQDLAVLVENLFQLCMMFWTDLHTDGVSSRNAIVHYSGVLGIHPYELAFRGAYDYTPYLSALIWVGRLLMLEYALPLRAYQHLTYAWPNRQYYSNQLERLQQIRTKYLFRGSLSPVGYLLERLRHGRATARHDGPPTNISWSPDGQVLQLGDGSISMAQFRRVIHSAIVQTRQQTYDLLFGWQPLVQLERCLDDLVNQRPGYSFLSHPQNGLQDTFRVLSRKAFSPQGGFSLQKKQGRKRIQEYLRSCDQLTALLYSAIHLTSGMPGRCEEVRRVRWANTMSVRRNVFLYRGQVILIFAYSKAITNHNNSFYVVRAPCPAVQQLLFIYLAYIRPFQDFLARQLQAVAKDAMTNPHLFAPSRDTESCFTASTCLSILRESTRESPIELSTSVYRQVVVSIAKKHLASLTQNFNPYTPFDENGLVRLLSWQSGHAPETHNRHYALEREFPAKLQPELIDRYLENSRIWHEFNLIREDDVLEVAVDVGVNLQSQQSRRPAPGHAPE